MADDSFLADPAGLDRALDLLLASRDAATENARAIGPSALPSAFPAAGVGDHAALEFLAPWVLDRAARLDLPDAFAHMDPPTPWLTWATTLWNAALNQNLLHPQTAPFARQAEELVVRWLAPLFGMDGGHLTPGSTVANLTALWAARELRGVRRVVASEQAHVSIAKAANLLALPLVRVPTDQRGRLLSDRLPGQLADACVVLTAGTTGCGAVDPLLVDIQCGWRHVDAAWAGPLVMSQKYAGRLVGIELADSVACSAHKWLFQPKESALVMFRDSSAAHSAVSFGAGYLEQPNVGLLGSHGAAAVPLLATLMAWGRRGVAARVERCMNHAERLAQFLERHDHAELFDWPETGVVAWRPAGEIDWRQILEAVPAGAMSTTVLDGQTWLRHVFANPNAEPERLIQRLGELLGG